MGAKSVNSFWNDARDAELCRLRDTLGPNFPEIAARLGHSSPEAVRVYYNAGRRAGRWSTAPALPIVTSEAPARTDAAKLWDICERQTAHDVARHAAERLVSVSVPDDRPIGLAFMSDQHIRTSGPIQLTRMREDAEIVRDTDGLYAVLGGDIADNHVKHLSAMIGGGSKVADEWRLADHYLKIFAPKILALISGNHDDFTRDAAGIDKIGDVAQINGIHYAPDEVMIHLDLGGVLYRVKMRHQYRYGSSFNLVHTVKRLWEMGQDPFDIGVVCHHHEAALEPFTKHGRTVWGARPGSYQLTSSYGRRYGFNLSTPTCPTFVLFPDRHEIMGFVDVRQAAGFLSYLRQGWPDVWRRAE